MTKRLILLTSILLVLGLVAFAADISGKWVAQVPGRNGQTREQTFNFKVDGNKLSGTVSGFRGQDSQISEGTVDGDKIAFTVKLEFNGNSFEQKYTGTVSGEEIKMSREGRNGAQEFTAKRAQ
ncbi:MAG TPA: hypothetical protein VG675_04305 [Bryobacteraceae bacterium]|nr:hypothetical protein [Bryobacteraceae bacterium]